MAAELAYEDEAAAGYDRAFGHVATHFIPCLLRAAHLAPNMKILDIAAGTGLAAGAALKIIGPGGHALPPICLPRWLRRHANAFTLRQTHPSKSKMVRLCHFLAKASTRSCAVSG